MSTEYDAFSLLGRASPGRFCKKADQVNVLFKVEDWPGSVKEERPSRKGEKSSKGKEEAISILGAPDMQVLSRVVCVCVKNHPF